MVPRVFFRKVHKWLSLIVGIQILAWTVSGFVMSYFPIEQVRGEHRIADATPLALDHGELAVGVAEILDRFGPATAIELRRWLGRPVYRIRAADGGDKLVDAATATVLTPLDREAALAVAEADFSGVGKAVAATLLTATNSEYRGAVPVWQVTFDDADGTHLYISPDHGAVVARRNEVWRLYDFFWMLHIMDYDQRTDFNHPLVVAAAVAGLCLGISGLLLVVIAARRLVRRS